ncbi:MAG: AAA family ATPase [Clostridia bacterium]|nr:AAA family ATPase [Clostridia bacterium]
MNILKMHINNFGKLENKKINLEKGINIIYGKNESGKSTLLKFIIGIFFGLSKNKNGKIISDYDKYTPWSNKEFSGKLEYELDNKNKYEIFREFNKKNPQIYDENLEEISKKFNIDKTNGNQFFYEQTNVDENLFKSTIVSEQQEIKLEEKEQNQLIQKMTNIISTGEDNISFQKIINKLNKKQLEEIGTKRSQDRPINILSNRLEEIENKKEYLKQFIDKKNEIEQKNKYIQNIIESKEIELEIIKKQKNIIENEELQKEKIKIKKENVEEYNEKINNLKNKKEILEKDNEIKKETLKIQIILEIIYIIITIIMLSIKNNLIATIGMIITILNLIYILYKKSKSKKNNKQKYNNKKIQINNIENEIKILEESKNKKIEQIKIEQNKIKYEKYLQENNTKEYYKKILPLNFIEEILNKKELNLEIEKLQNEINNEKISFNTNNIEKNNIIKKLEELVKIEEEYYFLQEQYKELKFNNEAIEIARQELENTYEEMKKNITPEFTYNLSKIISKISNGKYNKIKFDDKNGITVELQNGNYISAEKLSIGTIDQLYLSLRLAAANQISKENLPIILDEVFAFYDKERLENILKYINEEFENRQILIFTCTNRESELLEKNNITFNYITI